MLCLFKMTLFYYMGKDLPFGFKAMVYRKGLFQHGHTPSFLAPLTKKSFDNAVRHQINSLPLGWKKWMIGGLHSSEGN